MRDKVPKFLWPLFNWPQPIVHWGVWDVWSHSFGNEYYPLSDVEWLRKDLFQSSNFLLILHGNFVLSFDQEALFSNWVQLQS